MNAIMFDLHSTLISVTNQNVLIFMCIYARQAPNEKNH